MLKIEQVNLLETKVEKAIEHIEKLTAENAALVSEKARLAAKLEANQKRIDELEVAIMNFKNDQGRIEDGILAALDRLSQFEKAVEESLKDKQDVKKPQVKTPPKTPLKTEPAKTPVKAATELPANEPQSNAEVFFEIAETDTEEDSDILGEDSDTDNDDTNNDLDIF